MFRVCSLSDTIQISLDCLYRPSNLDIVQPSLLEEVHKGMIELLVKDNVFVFCKMVYFHQEVLSMGPLLVHIHMAHCPY